LPPFLQAVVGAWQSEFSRIPLSTNSIIFVIRPAQFYSDLNLEQEAWLASREMLGVRNFPLIINPLTPGDDWYLKAQQEWKRGNTDATYILLTSLFHEITHAQEGADESAAYQEHLALFQRFRKRGKLTTPYARACHESLRSRYADLRKHPEQYVQVHLRFQSQAIALEISCFVAPVIDSRTIQVRLVLECTGSTHSSATRAPTSCGAMASESNSRAVLGRSAHPDRTSRRAGNPPRASHSRVAFRYLCGF
jgi:hypothetical protein